MSQPVVMKWISKKCMYTMSRLITANETSVHVDRNSDSLFFLTKINGENCFHINVYFRFCSISSMPASRRRSNIGRAHSHTHTHTIPSLWWTGGRFIVWPVCAGISNVWEMSESFWPVVWIYLADTYWAWAHRVIRENSVCMMWLV